MKTAASRRGTFRPLKNLGTDLQWVAKRPSGKSACKSQKAKIVHTHIYNNQQSTCVDLCWVAKQWETCVDLCANLSSTKVSTSPPSLRKWMVKRNASWAHVEGLHWLVSLFSQGLKHTLWKGQKDKIQGIQFVLYPANQVSVLNCTHLSSFLFFLSFFLSWHSRSWSGTLKQVNLRCHRR